MLVLFILCVFGLVYDLYFVCLYMYMYLILLYFRSCLQMVCTMYMSDWSLKFECDCTWHFVVDSKEASS